MIEATVLAVVTPNLTLLLAWEITKLSHCPSKKHEGIVNLHLVLILRPVKLFAITAFAKIARKWFDFEKAQ